MCVNKKSPPITTVNNNIPSPPFSAGAKVCFFPHSFYFCAVKRPRK